MPPTFQSVAAGFVVLLVIFRFIEWRRPRDKRMPVLRRGFWTDLSYLAAAPITARAVEIGLALVLAPVVVWLYGTFDLERILAGRGALAQWPLVWQVVIILLVSDFFGYWMHRLFHGRRLWRFHAVHHSSTDLDWLSSVRVHPINDLVMKLATLTPLLFAGFNLTAFAIVTPILMLLAFLHHANVDWDFGPLRAIIASPRFHRWHHTDETEARDKNFAGLFPLWDIAFGTYYMPAGKLPRSFGTSTPVPAGLMAQLAFPFRRRRQLAPEAANTPQS